LKRAWLFANKDKALKMATIENIKQATPVGFVEETKAVFKFGQKLVENGKLFSTTVTVRRHQLGFY
jgi:hypothetical protein